MPGFSRHHRLTPPPSGRAVRRAFTLTEMLVATALTLIILLIFAQVFRSATRTIGVQRGIGQNDARARMLNTILRSDLQKATFRDHLDSTSRGLLTLGIYDRNQDDISFKPVHKNQAGYWYISENDPDNDIDDVLQFTVSVDELERNKENHPYVGRASQIARPTGANTGPGLFNPAAGSGNPDRNQPEFDDGNNANGASQSRFAEVVYFVRNGTLYRRVMLIRDPLKTAYGQDYAASPTFADDPPGGLSDPLIENDYDNIADFEGASGDGGDFWNDFDYTAIHTDPAELPVATDQVQFTGSNSLSNTSSNAPLRLSIPHHRFGFQYRSDYTAAYQFLGNPVEYVNGGATFIGRFTHQETSDPGFNWPAFFNAANNPLIQTDLTLANGVVRDTSRGYTFNTGPRRGEDIVLTNVDAFDIKLFQQNNATTFNNAGFFDLGHAGTGHLNASKRRNADYGPRTPSATVANNIFDTWHEQNIKYGRAPYRPLYADPLAAVENDDTLSTYNPRLPAARTSWDWEPDTVYDIRNGTTPGSRIYPFALPDSAYATAPDVGPDGKPGDANTDDDSDGKIDNAAELGWAGSDDIPDQQNDVLFYEAIDEASGGLTGTSGTGIPAAPIFLKKFGHRVIDNGILWQCYDNRVGVPLIQITVRYRDQASNLSRQLTIQHSLTDRSE